MSLHTGGDPKHKYVWRSSHLAPQSWSVRPPSPNWYVWLGMTISSSELHKRNPTFACALIRTFIVYFGAIPRRMWIFLTRGRGHFVLFFKKQGEENRNSLSRNPRMIGLKLSKNTGCLFMKRGSLASLVSWLHCGRNHWILEDMSGQSQSFIQKQPNVSTGAVCASASALYVSVETQKSLFQSQICV